MTDRPPDFWRPFLTPPPPSRQRTRSASSPPPPRYSTSPPQQPESLGTTPDSLSLEVAQSSPPPSYASISPTVDSASDIRDASDASSVTLRPDEASRWVDLEPGAQTWHGGNQTCQVQKSSRDLKRCCSITGGLIKFGFKSQRVRSFLVLIVVVGLAVGLGVVEVLREKGKGKFEA